MSDHSHSHAGHSHAHSNSHSHSHDSHSHDSHDHQHSHTDEPDLFVPKRPGPFEKIRSNSIIGKLKEPGRGRSASQSAESWGLHSVPELLSDFRKHTSHNLVGGTSGEHAHDHAHSHSHDDHTHDHSHSHSHEQRPFSPPYEYHNDLLDSGSGESTSFIERVPAIISLPTALLAVDYLAVHFGHISPAICATMVG